MAYQSTEFNKCDGNKAYVIEVQESAGAAGGRAAGMGVRKPFRITRFKCEGAGYTRTFECTEPSDIEKFEIPYHSTAMDVTLSSGATVVVSGVVDPEIFEQYEEIVEKLGNHPVKRFKPD